MSAFPPACNPVHVHHIADAVVADAAAAQRAQPRECATPTPPPTAGWAKGVLSMWGKKTAANADGQQLQQQQSPPASGPLVLFRFHAKDSDYSPSSSSSSSCPQGTAATTTVSAKLADSLRGLLGGSLSSTSVAK